MSAVVSLAHHSLAPKSHTKTIVSSLAAGVAAMVIVGAMTAFVMHGGLEAQPAYAATPIERMFGVHANVPPLNVEAVRAQIAASEAAMRVTQAATDPAISRLQRLSVD